MSDNKEKSIVFIHPCYHYSFAYRDEFRRLGWRADVFQYDSYPKNLLYSSEGNLKEIKLEISDNDLINKICEIGILGKGKFLFDSIIGLAIKLTAHQLKKLIEGLLTFCSLLQYKYHIYYSGADAFPMLEEQFHFFKEDSTKIDLGKSFRISLWFSKLLGIKIIYLPSGCMQQETKANFSKLDNGNVCNNCGWETCNDVQNVANFNIIRKYFDMVIEAAPFETTQYKSTQIKFLALDLNLWNPDIKIRDEFKLPATKKLRILHSFYDENREIGKKNIKGSPYIFDAVERLVQEGYPVEYFYINDVPSKYMRFYQVQADIVVEQLIYGWWGSTGVETMALGKPVVCYLRPSWKEHYLEHFTEYDELPIVEADTKNIYEVLKKLVIDKQYRTQKGIESRLFAEKHFDIKKNTKDFAEILLNL